MFNTFLKGHLEWLGDLRVTVVSWNVFRVTQGGLGMLMASDSVRLGVLGVTAVSWGMLRVTVDN